MVTEDYVSFGVAELLKKKKFDEVCRALYRIRDEQLILCNRLNVFDSYNNERIKEVGDENDAILAPTLQMVMKWLRDIHNVLILVDKTSQSEYRWRLRNNTTGDYVEGTGRNLTYEGACEDAIKFCLEEVI